MWYDGDSTISANSVPDLLADGNSHIGIWVDSITKDILRYNQLVPQAEQFKIKENCNAILNDWILPHQYQTLDVTDYIISKLLATYDKVEHDKVEHDKVEHGNSDQAIREIRVATELSLYNKLGLHNMLRTLIYVINTLYEKEVIWGVGRGSSVSSYVLYLIGVHDIDSVKYDLDINDFLRIDTD